MGGIHATMCLEEVMEHVDSVVMGKPRASGCRSWRTYGMAA